MTLRTCLLLSDDPDDHVEFSEALQEACADYVLMAVCDPAKAIELLALRRLVPDVVIADFALGGFDASLFFETMRKNVELSHLPVIAYGNSTDPSMRSHPQIRVFLDDNISYSALRTVLAETLNGASRS